MSKSIRPIHLYIKTHNKTGLKYFGKTTKENAHKYPGSGKHWRAHLEKHGYDYSTEIVGTYTDKIECQSAAIEFSEKNNIVESAEWANLIVESLDGGDTSNTQGYKDSFHKIIENGKKSKWWNNGSHQTFSEFPPDETYIRGRLPFNNTGAKIGTDVQRGKIWINNRIEELMIAPAEEIPPGFSPGRLPATAFAGGSGRHSPLGSRWWNNGVVSKMSVACPGSNYVPGRLRRAS